MPELDEKSGNGFGEYKRLILQQIEFQLLETKSLRKDLSDHDLNNVRSFGKLDTEIALLKQKAGTWGAIAGAVGAMLVTVVAQLIIHAMTK
jgi:hypothetical protein